MRFFKTIRKHHNVSIENQNEQWLQLCDKVGAGLVHIR